MPNNPGCLPSGHIVLRGGQIGPECLLGECAEMV